MAKKNKIDFVLEETDWYKIVFRFYPRQSSCHSFNEELPTKWEEVYKVYYHYRILKFWKEDDGTYDGYTVLFDSGCDECSIIDEIGHRCLLLADGTEVYEREDGRKFELLNKNIFPFGMGTEWTITKRTVITYGMFEEDEDIEKTYYTFMLFDYWGKGYKFTLEEKDMKPFGEYLIECCEYMLTHGDPI